MTRPTIDPEAVAAYLERAGVDLAKERVVVLGVRGGVVGENKIGIYDDTLVVVTEALCEAFHGNTDPSHEVEGEANLICGLWRYRPGIHHIDKPTAYPAFVQAGPVTVARWQRGRDTGRFGINIHRGGANTTTSEGCQTILRSEWDEFHALVLEQLALAERTSFLYVLVDRV